MSQSLDFEEQLEADIQHEADMQLEHEARQAAWQEAVAEHDAEAAHHYLCKLAVADSRHARGVVWSSLQN